MRFLWPTEAEQLAEFEDEGSASDSDWVVYNNIDSYNTKLSAVDETQSFSFPACHL